MGGGDQAGRGHGGLCLCGPAWDGLRRLVMGLQQESAYYHCALALLETAAAFIGGVGWVDGGWTGLRLRQLELELEEAARCEMLPSFLPWRYSRSLSHANNKAEWEDCK
jgi:hypothetical protein